MTLLTPPKSQHKFTLIFLHELGSSGLDIVNHFADRPISKFKIVLPTSNLVNVQALDGKKTHAWFDLKTFHKLRSEEGLSEDFFDHNYDQEAIIQACIFLGDLINKEINLLGGDSQRVFIGGFGQGATIAMAAYLSYNQGILGGVIASGGLMCANINWPKINIQDKKKVPVLLHHGINDNINELNYAKASYKLLKTLGLNHIKFIEEENLGHQISTAFIKRIGVFLSQNTDPSTPVPKFGQKAAHSEHGDQDIEDIVDQINDQHLSANEENNDSVSENPSGEYQADPSADEQQKYATQSEEPSDDAPVDSGLLDSANQLNPFEYDPQEKYFEEEEQEDEFEQIIKKEECNMYTQQDFEDDLQHRMEETECHYLDEYTRQGWQNAYMRSTKRTRDDHEGGQEPYSVLLKAEVQVEVMQGSILEEKVDAIVIGTDAKFEADDDLICEMAKKGGPTLEKLKAKHVSTEVGTCIAQKGGDLKAEFVIHSMDPGWEDFQDITLNTALLYKAVKNALIKANSYPMNCTSVAIPAMSIDLFDSNWSLYSRIYFDAILDFIAQRQRGEVHPLKLIRLINEDEDITRIFCEELNQRFPFKQYKPKHRENRELNNKQKPEKEQCCEKMDCCQDIKEKQGKPRLLQKLFENCKEPASLSRALGMLVGQQNNNHRQLNNGPNQWEIEENWNPHILKLHPQQKHVRTLIWLHGMDDTAQGYAGLFLDDADQGIKVPQGTKVVLPTAQQRKFTNIQERLVHSWFDVRFWDDPENPEEFTDKFLTRKCNQVHMKTSVNYVLKLIRAEAQILKDASQVFIGGFNQGCCIAIAAYLLSKVKLGGVIAGGGFHSYKLNWKDINIKQKKQTPVVLVHGQDDGIFSNSLAKISYDKLKKKGLDHIKFISEEGMILQDTVSFREHIERFFNHTILKNNIEITPLKPIYTPRVLRASELNKIKAIQKDANNKVTDLLKCITTTSNSKNMSQHIDTIKTKLDDIEDPKMTPEELLRAAIESGGIRLVENEMSVLLDKNFKLEVLHQDLVQQECDAIVTSVYPDLSSSIFNVDQNVALAGGPELLKNRQEILNKNNIQKAGTVITLPTCGSIKAKYLLHCVVPEYELGNQFEQVKLDLKAGIQNILKVANQDLKINSICMPALYYDEKGGFYVQTIIDSVLDFLAELKGKAGESHLKVIRFTNPEIEPTKAFKKMLEEKFPLSEEQKMITNFEGMKIFQLDSKGNQGKDFQKSKQKEEVDSDFFPDINDLFWPSNRKNKKFQSKKEEQNQSREVSVEKAIDSDVTSILKDFKKLESCDYGKFQARIDPSTGLLVPKKKAKKVQKGNQLRIIQNEDQEGVLILQPSLKHRFSLIWLHGMDASPEGFASLFLDDEKPIKVPKGCRIVLPQAPDSELQNGEGQCNWFQRSQNSVSQAPTGGNSPKDKTCVFSHDEIPQKTIEMVLSLIQTEIKLVKDSKRVFLGGFSQGCAVALQAFLKYTGKSLGGLIGSCGIKMQDVQSDLGKFQSQKKSAIYLHAGRDDPVFSHIQAKETVQDLKDKGLDQIELEIESGLGHKLSQAFKASLESFLFNHMSIKKQSVQKTVLIDLTKETNASCLNQTEDANLTPKKRKKSEKPRKKRQKKQIEPEAKKAPDRTEGPLKVSDFDFNPELDTPYKSGQEMPFQFVANALEELEQQKGTNSRNVIKEIIANVFRTALVSKKEELSDLYYFFLIKLAPAYDALETGVGHGIMVKAVSKACGLSSAQARTKFQKEGDLGDVAAKSIKGQKNIFSFFKTNTVQKLTFKKVFQGFLKIAKSTGKRSQEIKEVTIVKLLQAASPLEAKYIVRWLQGNLRTGVAEKTAIAALARAVTRSPTGKPDNKALLGEEEFALLESKVENLIREAVCQFPNPGGIIDTLLQIGEDYEQLTQKCRIQAGVPVLPMLAKPTKSISEILKRFEGMKFTLEYKYDGFRGQIHYWHLEGSPCLKVYSRNLEDMTQAYPDIVEFIMSYVSKCKQVKDFIIDCELVPIDRSQKTSTILPFQAITQRKRKNVKLNEIKNKVCITAFDLLFLNGQSLLTANFAKRRSTLRDTFPEEKGFFQLAKFKDADDVSVIEEFLYQSVNDNCEGLMVKTLEENSSYEPAKRSLNWLKVKKDYLGTQLGDSLDLVVVGADYGTGKRTGFYGSFLMASFDEDTSTFQTVCKVGTGLSDELLASVHTELKDFAQETPPKDLAYSEKNVDIWFKPSIVWEIKAAEISRSTFYRCALGKIQANVGVSLRFPRFIRARPDKKAVEASTSSQLLQQYRDQEAAFQSKQPQGKDEKEVD